MDAPAIRIWFNRHFSTIGRVLHQLQSAPHPLPLWTLVSHRHADFTGYAFASQALLEPADLDAPAYLEWCLATVRRWGITHLVPGHEQSLLTASADDFLAAGCTVVPAAPAAILPDLHRKDWVYEQLAGVVPLPEHEVVDRVDQALAAIGRLGERGEVAIKPCVSVYGKGFFRLVEGVPQRPDADTVAGWEARARGLERFPPHLVMRYLPGAEYSVDIAARHGQLLAAVVRGKDEENKVQTLLDRPDLLEHARALVARFQGNGLLNVQFKDAVDGTARLLEINPRAAGGIGMSGLSGVNLSDIAYRAALFPAWPLEIPTPRTGLRVAEISLAVALPVPAGVA